MSFAESIGGQDNLTAVVLPLKGWGGVTSEDTTKSRREFRKKNCDDKEIRSRRM